MHAVSRHGTPSLTSLPKDGGVSCFSRSSGRSPIQLPTVHSHVVASTHDIKDHVKPTIRRTPDCILIRAKTNAR